MVICIQNCGELWTCPCRTWLFPVVIPCFPKRERELGIDFHKSEVMLSMRSRPLIFLMHVIWLLEMTIHMNWIIFFIFLYRRHQSKIWFCWIDGLINCPIKSNDSALWPCRASAMTFDMMVRTFLRYNSQPVYDSLLTEMLSMHKWDYNHRRSGLVWSFIQSTPLLQAASWHFFQDSLDISFLTNDALVDCIDRVFSAVFSIFRRLICNRTLAFGVSALFESCSL